ELLRHRTALPRHRGAENPRPLVGHGHHLVGERRDAVGQRLPMGAEIASTWEERCSLGRAAAAAGFGARLTSTDRGWLVTFTRKAAPVGSRLL
ncbi:MAG: hypothetical protein ACRDJ9_16480, partial [Dehalococcoidia bacterium]